MIDKKCVVLENIPLQEGIYKLVLGIGQSIDMHPGQYVAIKVPEASVILRRPFCISKISEDKKNIDVIYQVRGKGTKILANIKKGEKLDVLLPLGTGFKIKDDTKKVLLIGGGMGCVLLPIIMQYYKDITYDVLLGFQDKSKIILHDYFVENANKVYLYTDNGSFGKKGFLTQDLQDIIKKQKPDQIIACGPEIMYKAILNNCDIKNIPFQVSLERRMGCGIGACLVCNCKVKGQDDYFRACTDGPVFDIKEVEL